MNNFTLQFRDVVETAKSLKADIIYIKGNTIYGVDDNFTYLKQMTFDNILGLEICYNQKLMNDFMKVCTNDIVIQDNSILSNIETLYINNQNYIKNILTLNNKINNILLSNINIMNIDTVRGNEQFESAISLKTSQGIGLYKVNEQYIMSIFKGLLPINKPDKVSLSIYDVDNTRFLTRFVISKPKNKAIIVNVMYLKIR